MKNIAVIGAGASGMMAAITAASAGASVTLYERNDQVGKKILQTGNGKCNFSNTVMNEDCFHGSARDTGLVKKVLERFDENKAVEFFESIGILPRVRYGGYYPFSEQASAIKDAMYLELIRRKVKLVLGHQVRNIQKKKNGFVVDDQFFDAVILSTGGKASPKSGSTGDGYYLAEKLGVHSNEALPALTYLTGTEKWFKNVAGVRVEASLKLMSDGKELDSSRGELQLTDQGISGICTFQLSAQAGRMLKEGHKVKVLLNFMPDMSFEEVVSFLNGRRSGLDSRKCSEFLIGVFPEKLCRVILQQADINIDASVKKLKDADVRRLAGCISFLAVNIKGTGGFDRCQVTSGGILADQLTDELEVKDVPGFFAVGEVVDCDGICGGYNLQWAWSSGYIAGMTASGK
ncbi:hypothetical protein SAMN06296386_104170 [Lachnospiraceae bacterium]|nr:hypothetical protein SAMN06296386_104170 [Lachnospiraceae bacterium]